jgi:hypothetical protein
MTEKTGKERSVIDIRRPCLLTDPLSNENLSRSIIEEEMEQDRRSFCTIA